MHIKKIFHYGYFIKGKEIYKILSFCCFAAKLNIYNRTFLQKKLMSFSQ